MRGGRRRLFTDFQCAELWRMYRAGESILGIGRALGGGGSAVRRVLESTGGIAPTIRRRSSRVLSFVEREEISRGIAAGLAKILRRCVHTVQELIFSMSAITLLGCPLATIRTISCSRGLRRIRQ